MYTIHSWQRVFHPLHSQLLQLVPTRWLYCSQFVSLWSTPSKPRPPHGRRRAWWRPLPRWRVWRGSQRCEREAVEGRRARVRDCGRETKEGGVGGQRWQAGGEGEVRGKWRERRRGGVRGERRRKPRRRRRGEVVMAWCGARMRLKWGVRWKQQLRRLLFPLRCANGIHICCIWPLSRLSLSHSLAEVCVVWPLALWVMFQPLNQVCSLCRCYFVHVAGQLGHTLLKTCTLDGGESRSTRVMKVYRRSMSVHVAVGRVCKEWKDTRDKTRVWE